MKTKKFIIKNFLIKINELPKIKKFIKRFVNIKKIAKSKKKLFSLLKTKLISKIINARIIGIMQKFKKVKKLIKLILLLNMINAGNKKVESNAKYLFFTINYLVFNYSL
tara:strand:+ start:627 stop:953 length:327 start_codon:yes stop_codon:yes gene_type:complete